MDNTDQTSRNLWLWHLDIISTRCKQLACICSMVQFRVKKGGG